MKYLFIIFLASLSLTLNAQGIYRSKEGEISFFSASSLENIEAHNKNFTSLINTATKEIVFVIPVRNFKFKSSLMEEHFNEKYIESEKYPDAAFKGKINEDIDFSKEGEYQVTATGTMTMHGVSNPVTQSGTLTIKDGTITLKSEFSVALKDYKISVPKLIIEKIAAVIPVKLNVNYLPYKKE